MPEFKRPGAPSEFESPDISTDPNRRITPVEIPKTPSAPLAPPPRPKGATGATSALPPPPPQGEVTRAPTQAGYAGPERRSTSVPPPGPERRATSMTPAGPERRAPAGPPPSPERRMATQQRRAVDPSAPPPRTFFPQQPRSIE